MKAYKAFKEDWTCRGHKFEIGKTYEVEGKPILCAWGFHACINPVDCFNYYDFNEHTKFAEVELMGQITDAKEGCTKVASSKIRIIKEIHYQDLLKLVNIGSGNYGGFNTGDHNSGHRNTGNFNSGDSNTGYSNTGHHNSGQNNSGDFNSGHGNAGYFNSGDFNTGDFNSGDFNTGLSNSGDYNSTSNSNGYFNTETQEYISVFNKPCRRIIWDEAIKPALLNIPLSRFISKLEMTTEEKEKNPHYELIGGYLKVLSYEDAWAKSWDAAYDSDKLLLYALPNFDPKVFEEITGIDVTQDTTWKSHEMPDR